MLRIANIFKRKKYDVPCVCYEASKAGIKDELVSSECLSHTLIHKNGGYKNECPYCNYDKVEYQYQVKINKPKPNE